MKMAFSYSRIFDVIEQYTKTEENVEKICEKGLEYIRDSITEDIKEAIKDTNLPAKAKYSTGYTKSKLYENQPVEWKKKGVAEVKVGFESGYHANFLIGGGMHYAPDKKLNTIYKSKAYKNKKMKELEEFIISEVTDEL